MCGASLGAKGGGSMCGPIGGDEGLAGRLGRHAQVPVENVDAKGKVEAIQVELDKVARQTLS